MAFLRCKAYYLAPLLKRHSRHYRFIWGTGPTGLKLHDLLVEQGLRIDGFYDINPKLEGRTKRGLPVKVLPIPLPTLAPSEQDTLILIAISKRGAAHELELEFRAQGLVGGLDYLRIS